MKFKSKLDEKRYYEQEAEQDEFLEWYKKQDLPTYEKPSVTIDNVIFTYDKKIDDLQVLLIKRKANPFKQSWAITGGFVDMAEDIVQTVIREVKEEVGLTITENQIEQLETFGSPTRDPRSRVISIAHLSFLPNKPEVIAGDDAKEAQWFSISKKDIGWVLKGTVEGTVIEINESNQSLLAFDHESILFKALKRIEGSLNWKPNILHVLGKSFTLPEARKVYAKFLPITSYKEIDLSNFKKTHGHLFEEIGVVSQGVGRPAKQYVLKKQLLN